MLGAILVLAMVLSLPGSAAPSTRELYEQVVALDRRGEYEEAVRLARELVRLEPRNDLYLAYASHVERMAGEYESGLAHALAAVAINPHVGWYHASVAFNACGDLRVDLAREQGQKVVALGVARVGEANHRLAREMLERLAERTLHISWTLHPERGVEREGRYRIPVPSTGLLYQEAVFQVARVQSSQEISWEENRLLEVIPLPGEAVRLDAQVRLRPHSYREALRSYRDGGALPPEAALFLEASEGINPASQVLRDIVASVRGKDRLATVRRILAWQKRHLRYQVEDFHDVEELVARGHAECGGWSALFVGLCRAAGIPARVVWGVVEDITPEHRIAPAGHLKGHAWAEVWLGGAGWVPVEPQSPETLGLLPTTYVRMCHWDRSSSHWTRETLRASDNMVLMGGDAPLYRRGGLTDP